MDVLDEWAEWAQIHLPGPPTAHGYKAGVEWGEFERSETVDEECQEAVDVILALTALLAAHGKVPSKMVGEKVALNRARTWVRQPDGTYQHA